MGGQRRGAVSLDGLCLSHGGAASNPNSGRQGAAKNRIEEERSQYRAGLFTGKAQSRRQVDHQAW